MTETEFKKQKSAKFLAEHTLSKEKLQNLLDSKYKRAKALSEALKKREALIVESR